MGKCVTKALFDHLLFILLKGRPYPIDHFSLTHLLLWGVVVVVAVAAAAAAAAAEVFECLELLSF